MRRSDLTTTERGIIINFLLRNSKNGRINHGKVDEAMQLCNTSRAIVSRLWATAKKQEAKRELMVIPSAKITKPRGKRLALPLHLLTRLPLQQRSTIRGVAVGIKITKSTMGRWIKCGLIRSHTSAIQPDLTAPNKLLRLRFSLEAIEFDRLLNVLKFKSMYNTVHIDEKWFYITKAKNRFYMGPKEEDPHRTTQSKAHIPKVMFICAVCRPIFGIDGSVLFDGKIGIFPFIQEVEAIRGSKRRPKGTKIIKPIESITKDVIKDCLIKQIIPAIKLKWPQILSKNILIQQDNARPHIKDCDQEFIQAATSGGFNMKLVQQPPNSPDTNINDLGWFRALQSIQVQQNTKTVVELLGAVAKSFEELCLKTLNNVFLSLQGCMVEILKVRSQNSYKIPHMKKGALARQGNLPIDLQVLEELVIDCIKYLTESGIVDGIDRLKDQLGITDI